MLTAALLAASAFSFAGDPQDHAETQRSARCVVESGRDLAGYLFAALPIDGGEIGQGAEALLRGAGCPMPAAGAALQLRGAIAEQLFSIDFREFGTAPRNRGAWIDLGLPTEADDEEDDSPAGQLYRWADCVVRNDTGNVERLLRTPAGSRREAAVMSAMQPYMSACVDPDARLVVAPSELRSLFAQAAYQTLRRYWSGELRQAGHYIGQQYGAVTGGADLQTVTCKRYPVAGTRTRTVRFCMTEREWRKAQERGREWAFHATSTGLQD